MRKFPKIFQFADMLQRVTELHDYAGKIDNIPQYEHISPYPTLTFVGRAKLHGINCAFGLESGSQDLVIQTREQEVDINSLSLANHGFEAFCKEREQIMIEICQRYEFKEFIRVYGEFCGGHIQAKVGVSKLPKMFVAFAICIDGKFQFNYLPRWMTSDIDYVLGSNYEVTIDINHPELSQDTLIKATNEVVQQCPFAFDYGVEGPGEGIVWTCVDYLNRGIPLQFKTKNADLSAFKGRTVADYDVLTLSSVDDFCSRALTPARIEQGKQYLQQSGKTVDASNTGYFVAWIVNDVITEQQLTMEKNKISKSCAKKALKDNAIILYKESISN
jgi:RNA ligase